MKLAQCLVTISLLLYSSTLFATQTVTISTSDWPPYVSQKLPNYGYISQIIIEAFKQENIEVNFIFVPWARAYEEAKHGNVDATSYWYKDDKHNNDFYLSRPLSTEKVVFFRLKSDKPITWRTLSSFDDLTIGLTRSYTYTQALWEYAEKHQDRISIVNTDKQNLKMLLLERIDVTPVQELVGWHHLQTMFGKEQINRVEVMFPPLSVRTGHLLFPRHKKGSKALIEKFNRGLTKMAITGRLEELQEALILGEFSH